MDDNYISFRPNPSKPRFMPPPGAVDAHCHVFGPADQFPFAPERKYTPCDATKEQLFALRDFLGFSRNVIVQSSCHGRDNAAMVDALNASDGLARGVAVVRRDITMGELLALHEAGVRGVRFNLLKRLVEIEPMENYLNVATKVTHFGWHIVVYFEVHQLEGLLPLLRQLPGNLVVDHMALQKVAGGVEHPDFLRFINLMETNKRVWVKVSCPERLSLTEPPYDDVVPFAAELVERFPDRVLWGTDWPHANMHTLAPDDGVLVDHIVKIAPSEELQQQMLVENPMRLYWAD